jgi:predicted nucleic-acid-binding Zn-ribbon protein
MRCGSLGGMKTIQNPCEMTCPKCGGSDILRLHREKGDVWVSDEEETPFVKKHTVVSSVAVREHIGHYCRTCKYSFQSRVLPVKVVKP